MFAVKVYRPNKNGELKYKKKISAKKCSQIHWAVFRGDPNRNANPGSILKSNPGVKYHRVGADLKKCAEKGCKVIVEDPRRKTCSPECQGKRLDRQRAISRRKKLTVKTEATCQECNVKFMAARKDRVYCSKQCRNGRKR